jgi:hypothetical protein
VIYAATLTPFEPRELTDGSMSVGYASWSPDERFLAVEVKDGATTHARSSTRPLAGCGC